MKKVRFIIAAMAILLFSASSFAAEKLEETETTLVVGNSREKGFAVNAMAKIVEQDSADFTHTKSFKGNVVSVDIAPLRSPSQLPHLVLDFVNAPDTQILKCLENRHPQRILFEWFPSCITASHVSHNSPLFTPLLLPALKNAFNVLSTGGEVIIDHLPYVACLPIVSKTALEKLADANGPLVQRVRDTLYKHNFSDKPGIVSALLQKHDPFTLHISWGEFQEIRDCLMYRVKNNNAPFDDSKCQFIKGKAQKIEEIITIFSKNLGMGAMNLMILINNGMVYYHQAIREEDQGYSDLFAQHYFMKTRDSGVIKALREIGFTVSNDAIQYFAENPYNNRKHAWLIKAKK